MNDIKSKIAALEMALNELKMQLGSEMPETAEEEKEEMAEEGAVDPEMMKKQMLIKKMTESKGM